MREFFSTCGNCSYSISKIPEYFRIGFMCWRLKRIPNTHNYMHIKRQLIGVFVVFLHVCKTPFTQFKAQYQNNLYKACAVNFPSDDK